MWQNKPFLKTVFVLLIYTAVFQNGIAQTSPPKSTDDAAPLETGKPAERQIAGGQKQTYKLALTGGQYADISVEQIGIDVLIRVLGDDGKPIGEFDGDVRTKGTETVCFPVRSAGVYTIEIETKVKNAPQAAYKILLNEIRPATEKDYSVQEARNLLANSARLSRAGKDQAALAAAEQGLAILEKNLGPDDYRIALALNRVGIVYYALSENIKSEEYLKRAFDIYERRKQPDDMNAGDTMNNIAGLYRIKGDFAEAEKLFLRALTVREKELGVDSTLVAGTLNNMGILYRQRGDNAKAQAAYARSLEIRERLFGAESLEVAPTLTNLAAFYYYRGEPEAALKIDRRVLAIYEKNYPPEHPYIARTLSNIALMHTEMEDYATAEPIYQKALSIYEKTGKPDDVRMVPTLNNLAKLYTETGALDKAEPVFLRSLKIYEKNAEDEDIELAGFFKNLGDFYTVKEDYAQAESYFKRAVATREKILGADHYLVGRTCSTMARMYLLRGDAAQAIANQECANRLGEKNTVLNLAIGTEHEKLSYMALSGEDLNQTIALQTTLAPDDKAVREMAATAVLQRKGRVLDATAAGLTELRRRSDPQDQLLIDQLRDTTAQLAELTLNKADYTKLPDYEKRIATLQERKDKLESQISRRSAGFYEASQPITLSAVEAAIPDKAALIEYAVYDQPNRKTFESAPDGKVTRKAPDMRYAVYVITSKGEVRSLNLGSMQEIDANVDALRNALRDPKRTDTTRLARELDRKIMQPVRAMLGDATQLLVSPDGDLNLIPFEALIDEQGKYLIERYSVNYLTSGRDLLRMKTPRTSKSQPLIIANPSFGAPSAQAVNASDSTVKTSSIKQATGARGLTDTYFAPLDATVQEARSIQTLFPDAKLLTGSQATETALKDVAAPSILHISTHGFFLENASVSPRNSLEKSTRNADSTGSEIKNPLLRSGLALAGANEHKKTVDDGILTALEASGLNLWGTKLVVLSACDTGVGEVKNGEGVYGLRRAFVLAGAETLVMSLWAVSDTVTRELMTGYYKNLKAGMGRGAALRQVQLAMLKKTDRRHPFYWAAFIQSGEWAKLDKKQ